MTAPSIPNTTNVLVVDDIPAARNITVRLLKKLGISTITEAGTIAQAISAVQNNAFQLIITDVHLKDELATDLIKQVKAMPGKEQQPFVVITSDMERSTFTEIASLGVSSYLLKPFSAQTLSERIVSALGTTS